MICTHCKKNIYFEEYYSEIMDLGENNNNAIEILAGYCPACEGLLVILNKGDYNHYDDDGDKYIGFTANEKINVYPMEKNNILNLQDIPGEFYEDYLEAKEALQYSCKASAALSRRCLQNLLHNKLKINKRNLVQEIQEFIDNEKAPSYIKEAIDAVRNIGNFAAHPLKDTNTGEIVPVEPGEAEWLVEVLELLFDFYFVQPKKLKERKRKLNEKLKKLGKPKMK